MIYQKNYETIGYMMLYIFTRIQRVSKLYFKVYCMSIIKIEI